MKIIYALGNRLGAEHTLIHFLKNTNHQIFIAGFESATPQLENIHWTLDALFQSGVEKKRVLPYPCPLTTVKETETLIQDIIKCKPDLIISDGDFIVSVIAQIFKIRLWTCSPLHLLDGVDWEPRILKYKSLLLPWKRKMEALTFSEKKLVYSPFGDVRMGPRLKADYDWVKPYYDIKVDETAEDSIICWIPNLLRRDLITTPFNIENTPFKMVNSHQDYLKYFPYAKWSIISGETHLVANAIFHQRSFAITPDTKDPETLINANIVSNFHLGSDLGQLEFLEQLADNHIVYHFLHQNDRKEYLDLKPWKTLHEKVHEICNVSL